MTAGSEEVSLPASVRRFLPPFSAAPLGPLLTLSLRSLARRRPALFERLGEHRSARFLLDPTDLSFAFSVVPDGASSIVRVTGKSGILPCDVVIRGPLLTLLGVLDGTLDGDALFFHRAIAISGKTEAVLALRNAIEDAELCPSDLLGLRGTLGRLADAGMLGGLSAARYFTGGGPSISRARHERRHGTGLRDLDPARAATRLPSGRERSLLRLLRSDLLQAIPGPDLFVSPPY